MLKQKEIKVGGKVLEGVEITLPGANLVLVIGSKGYIMCGYLDIQTAEKLNQAAAIVRGVKTTEDLINAKLVAVSSKAKELGVSVGQSAFEALKLLA